MDNTNTGTTNGNVLPEEPENQGVTDTKDRIINTLTVYKRLSPSMLQIGIGPSLSPKIWRPILEQLIADGKVKQEEEIHTLPSGRVRSYTVISLVTPVQ